MADVLKEIVELATSSVDPDQTPQLRRLIRVYTLVVPGPICLNI